MLDRITEDSELFYIRRQTCCENNYCAEIDENLNEDDYVILKIDEYYRLLHMQLTPPAVDCLIAVKCCEADSYEVHLIELRNTSSLNGIKIPNIVEKFKTTIHDFMETKFAKIFMDDSVKIKGFYMYLVTNPSNKVSENRFKGTKLDILQSTKPLSFRGLIAQINPVPPSPLIQKC